MIRRDWIALNIRSLSGPVDPAIMKPSAGLGSEPKEVSRKLTEEAGGYPCDGGCWNGLNSDPTAVAIRGLIY